MSPRDKKVLHIRKTRRARDKYKTMFQFESKTNRYLGLQVGGLRIDAEVAKWREEETAHTLKIEMDRRNQELNALATEWMAL